MAHLPTILVGTGIAGLTYAGVRVLKPIVLKRKAALVEFQASLNLIETAESALAASAAAGSYALAFFAMILVLVFGSALSGYLWYKGWFGG